MKAPIVNEKPEGETPPSSTGPVRSRLMGEEQCSEDGVYSSSTCQGELLTAAPGYALAHGDIVLLEWAEMPSPSLSEYVLAWIADVERDYGIRMIIVPRGVRVVR